MSGRHGYPRATPATLDMWRAIGEHMLRYGAPPPRRSAQELIIAATRPHAAAPTIPIPTPGSPSRKCPRTVRLNLFRRT